MKKYRTIIFPIIVIGYALLYIATRKDVPCDGDCAALYRFDTTIKKNRNYVWNINRCFISPAVSDTLCIGVDGTLSLNWNLFADTCCQIAAQVGLNQQKIIIYNSGVFPVDTLAKKTCP